MALTNAQRRQLERRLQEERGRIQRAFDQSVDEHSNESERDRTGDLTALPFHVADQGTDTMQAELDASNATRMSRQLAEIDAALEAVPRPGAIRDLRGYRRRHPGRAARCDSLGTDLRAGGRVTLAHRGAE